MQILSRFFLFIFIYLAYDALYAQNKQLISPEVQLKLSAISRQPAELLRLAYLREQKENFEQALFYLNLYVLTTHDAEALITIEQLAARYRLLGYEHNDLQWLQLKYRQYFNYLLVGVLGLWGGVLLYWVYAWAFGKKILSRYKIIWTITLLAWIGLFNLYQEDKMGIVASEEVYLMDAPSAGGRLLKVISKGHRITILDEQDIWYKIRWQGKLAYLRKNYVWKLSL